MFDKLLIGLLISDVVLLICYIVEFVFFILWVRCLFELFCSCCLFCLSIEIYNLMVERILNGIIIFFIVYDLVLILLGC